KKEMMMPLSEKWKRKSTMEAMFGNVSISEGMALVTKNMKMKTMPKKESIVSVSVSTPEKKNKEIVTDNRG
ncbi:hypothetical protein U1Q18_008413, partial [Sarracenia purpurea var. burkii]